jgi:hypothetical protein
MVSKNTLLGKLDPFLGKKDVLVYNQDTTDIIDGILKNHQKYESEYDKIYRYFVEDDNTDQTAYNIWCFLKDEFKYTIEPEKMQVLRSPAAILSDRNGIDCKGYATAAAGLMSAWKRNGGKKFDVVYRFASYDAFDKTPQHVFVVIKEDGNEYWIDPVLDEYDQKKQPYFYKDKKINDMALIALSGVNRVGNTNDNYNNNINGISDGMDFSTIDTTVAAPSTAGFDWTNIFTSLLQVTPSLIKASQPTPTYGYSTTATTMKPVTASTGISTNTLLLIAAAGLGVYFFTKKKGK